MQAKNYPHLKAAGSVSIGPQSPPVTVAENNFRLLPFRRCVTAILGEALN